jgi:Carboxypeptidase regulatory-like domain
MRLWACYFLISIFALHSFSKGLSAQSTTTGGLTGVVTDPSGAVAPDTAVELKDNWKGDTQSTRTDGEGVYQYSFLRPGSYVLTVTHPGFRATSRNLYVSLGPPGTLNVQLALESSPGFTVRVTDEVPLLKAENGDASTTINQLQVSQEPNPGNDLTYVAQIAPGVIMNTDVSNFTNFSSFGMPGTSNFLTINGMSYNELGANVPLTGALNLLLGLNQIQEATVVSYGYSGTFGTAAGTNVNYITKSGGDAFHGNASYYWNGRVLNANDWIANANGLPRVFDNANQWGASFGGPIKRNKLFFFFDIEGISLIFPVPVFFIQLPSPQFEAATLANIDTKFGQNSASDKFYRQMFNLYNATPGASAAMPGAFDKSLGCYGFIGPVGLGTTTPCAVHFTTTRSSPSHESLESGRIDWNLGSNDQVFLLVQYDHGHQAGYLDSISPLFDVSSDQPWWQGQLSETHSFGGGGANQFLAAGWWFSAFFQPKDYAKALAAFPTTLSWPTTGAFPNLGGADNDGISGTNETQYQISDDFAKSSGGHKLSFGVSFLRADWTNVSSYNAIGNLAPQTLQAFYEGGVDPGILAGTDSNPDFTVLNQSFYSRNSERFAFYHLGLYGQDEWHVRPALTLTLALRAEHQSNPVCRDHCFARLAGAFESVSHDPNQPYNQAILINQTQAYEATDSIVWSPRFSFAWQPFGLSHNTVIRGGIGIFYDRLPGSWPLVFSHNSPLVNSFTVFGDNLTPDEVTSVFKTAAASNHAFLNGFSSGQTLAQMQAEIPNFAPPALSVPDSVLHSPQYQKWDLEIQRAFGAATSLSVGYYGNHGVHEVVVNPSANAFGFGSFPAGQCASPPVLPCADPRFSQVTEVTTQGISNYNGMVVSFQHRFSGWSQGMFQANYTYGHALDEVSNGGFGAFTSGSSANPQDPYNLRGSYGPAEYDVRHSLNANYVWELPMKALLRGHGSDHIVNGWQISGTIFARTGFPYTVFDYFESGNLATNNFFGSIYAVPVSPLGPGGSCGKGAIYVSPSNPCQPPQVLAHGSPAPNARFVQAGCETGFNSGTLPGPSGPCGGAPVSFAQGRNRFRGPGLFNTDFSIIKTTKLPGREITLGMGIQMFNAFNHPNFGLPDNNLTDSGFGQIFYMAMPPTSILGAGLGGDASPRMIQLKLQLQF